MNNDLLTVCEVASILSLCRQSVYKHIKSGAIPAFKNPAGKYLIPRSYIEDQLAGCYNDHTIINSARPAKEG